MIKEEVFGKAKWICAKTGNNVPLIRKDFMFSHGETAALKIIGLGTFVCYINGKRVSDDYFLPLCSKYENTVIPEGEDLFGFRTYVTEYDITEYLKEGKNTLSVMLGEGWYTELRYYGVHFILGEKKLIFNIKSGDREYFSDGTEKYTTTFIERSGFHEGGEHDYRNWDDSCMLSEYDTDSWNTVSLAEDLKDCEYSYTDCPADKIIKTIPVTKIYEKGDVCIYDCGLITTGYPIVVSRDGCPGDVEISFSELMNDTMDDLDADHCFKQHLYAKVTEKSTEIFPRFTWFGFRYFKVKGKADCHEMKIVHSGISQSSSFESSDPTLNWLYEAYLNTQLTNIHRGVPSDCPHLERHPYTGDGQLVSRSAMLTLDAQKLYKKWIADISDCQDKITGRVQYTAPTFIDCGGGPGGWGCAIAVVPYEYYKAYGDDTYIRKLYPQMIKFLDFLEDNSESDLVTSFKPGRWCLGDWCSPEKGELPAPFVNTYFRIYTTMIVSKIARIIGKIEDIERFEKDIEKCKAAINKFYYNSFSSDACYCANYRGANAFALAIGLGTERTVERLVDYYDRIGYFDTGIFGTEVVARQLFENQAADVAFKLLTANKPYGYGHWREIGATTIREYWNDKSRSHSHPMFGSTVATLFEYILGIKQTEESAGYKEISIAPAKISSLSFARGHITSPYGKISVEYETVGDERRYKILIPEGATAKINIPGMKEVLVTGGEYEYTTKI